MATAGNWTVITDDPLWTQTGTGTFQYVWREWLATTTASTTAYRLQDQAWGAWVEDDDARCRRRRIQEDAAQRQREAYARAELARAQREQELADARARSLALLDGLLTEDERAQSEREKFVMIEGIDGYLYRLEMHRDVVHGNIVKTDEHGCILGRACVAPGMYGENGVLPTPDGWVGQYLGLKFDTVEFLSHANWSMQYECREQAA